jgi:hypothetical protein
VEVVEGRALEGGGGVGHRSWWVGVSGWWTRNMPERQRSRVGATKPGTG